MHRLQKGFEYILCVCLVAAVFFGASIDADAASDKGTATQTSLPAGILVGDEHGIGVDNDGYYYIDARELKPGDVIQKTLTLQNLSQSNQTTEGKAPYHLTMTSEPLYTKGPVDLLDKVELTLVLDGKTVYKGPSRGNGSPDMVKKALRLGTYRAGDRKTLKITLTVDPSMQLSEQKSEADFRWRFYAYRDQEEKGPKTGIIDKYGYFLPIGSVMLLCLLLVPLKKRRDKRNNPV
jgi:hypothetical protein